MPCWDGSLLSCLVSASGAGNKESARPPAHPFYPNKKNSRGLFNTATLSQAVPAWLRPLSVIIPVSYSN